MGVESGYIVEKGLEGLQLHVDEDGRLLQGHLPDGRRDAVLHGVNLPDGRVVGGLVEFVTEGKQHDAITGSIQTQLELVDEYLLFLGVG